ncbi:MAG: ATP-binding protein, partial [Holophaga sp.]|nr:ATP-binding protein [Holophaga sp.]
NLSAELTRSGGSASMVESVIRSVASQFQSRASILLPDENGHLTTQGNDHQAITDKEIAAAQWVFDHQEAAGLGTDTLPGAKALNLPLNGSSGIIGVMAVQPEGVPKWTEPDQRHLLEAFANQTALALERALLVEKGAKVQQNANLDHLRNTLLSSVSHDLCSPLARILDVASTLLQENDAQANLDYRQQAEIIQGEAQRLQRQIKNLLDVTRLESGHVVVNKVGVAARQLIESALNHASRALKGRNVKLEIPPNLPLIPADPLLMEQVLINLLENAANFSPKDQSIELRAWATDRSITLAVLDRGSGLPVGLEEKIFEKLVRASTAQGETGGGLGLTICKGIVEAHGGWIQGSNRAQGGAQFLVSLPLEESPPGERT